MTQTVNDRTEQHASSVRNRRATAVREVSQSEHEQISTRVVANYNHMHALTVQYYEVVQVYRALSQLHSAQRVLFLPFEFLDFSAADGMDVVARYRDALLSAALTPRIFELLLGDEAQILIRPGVLKKVPILVGNIDFGNLAAANTLAATVNTTGPAAPPAPAPEPAPEPTQQTRTVTRPGAVLEPLSGDAKLTAISFDGISIERVRLDQPGTPADDTTFLVPAGSEQIDLTTVTFLRSLEAIHVSKGNSTDTAGTMILRFESKGQQGRLDIDLTLKNTTSLQKAAYIEADPSNRKGELLAHLQANRAHYTREVLLDLDSAALVMLLSGTSWKGRPLADQVEPNPVSVAGNFLVLRAPVDETDDAGLDNAGTTWKSLLDQRGLDFKTKDSRLIPIPTGGVFAEAVLGRSNSAEKLDITRFWNWQDSPIPLQPTEIAPISAGSRAQAENLTPGQLGSPVLNITNPTNLPDPAGLGASFTALGNQIFRDMSGLAATQAAAQAAGANTLDAATAAGKLASDNFKIATDQAVAMGQAAVDLWKIHKSSSKGSGKDSSGSNASTDGAMINQGRDLDERGVKRGNQPVPSAPSNSEGTDFMSPATTSLPGNFAFDPNEIIATDEALAFSPSLLGATTASLASGTPTLMPASFITGFSKGRISDTLITMLIMGDMSAMNIPLQGIAIIPMKQHANSTEFKKTGYLGWTNSAKEVFYNLDAFHAALASNSFTDLAKARAFALFVMQHEVEHVNQFIASGGHPNSFKEMAIHEANAYGNDLVWAALPQVKDYFINKLKLTPNFVGDFNAGTGFLGVLKTSATDAQTFFDLHKNNNNDLAVKQALIVGPLDIQGQPIDTVGYIPATIQGNAGYSVSDMYKK